MYIARIYDRAKFKFDKLTIDTCDLALEEGTPRMLMLRRYYLLMNE